MWFLRQYIQFSVLDLQTEHCKWVKLNYQSIPKFEAIVGLLKYKFFWKQAIKKPSSYCYLNIQRVMEN